MDDGINSRVVIVGAGHAGGSVAAFLRQSGHQGDIVLLGDQPYPPYQRPPLSKAYLKNEVDAESLKLRADNFYAEQNIAFRPGVTVITIDRAGQRVQLDGGGTETYDYLILATGSRARRLGLPGEDAPNVHLLTSIADADALRGALPPGQRLAIIGGGYVGLEVAASARKLGADAVIVERESRLLARVACEPLSDFFRDYHRGHGVEILTSAIIQSLEYDTRGRVCAILLADGRRVACDAVLVGIGALPRDELAAAAGLACDGGIVVDAQARTSDPRIFAIGDVTRRPLFHYDNRMVRLESVPNAIEQGKQAASAILQRPAPQPEVPWFWSDQFDIKLQIAGMPLDSDRFVIRGDPASDHFAVFHMKNDQVRAVEAVNAPSEFLAGRQLIASGRPIASARLQDLTVTMKQLAAESA
jgi:3-phenylpropionate/trans-cinnamate dioxygenase ferredoxin reductase subunit